MDKTEEKINKSMKHKLSEEVDFKR